MIIIVQSKITSLWVHVPKYASRSVQVNIAYGTGFLTSEEAIFNAMQKNYQIEIQ